MKQKSPHWDQLPLDLTSLALDLDLASLALETTSLIVKASLERLALVSG